MFRKLVQEQKELQIEVANLNRDINVITRRLTPLNNKASTLYNEMVPQFPTSKAFGLCKAAMGEILAQLHGDKDLSDAVGYRPGQQIYLADKEGFGLQLQGFGPNGVTIYVTALTDSSTRKNVFGVNLYNIPYEILTGEVPTEQAAAWCKKKHFERKHLQIADQIAAKRIELEVLVAQKERELEGLRAAQEALAT